MFVKIYQLPIENERVFAGLDRDKVNLNDYEEVWSGEVEAKDLEDVYFIFNMNHPLNYKGRSLSVSDIVEENGHKWYCDTIGWKLLLN